MPTDDLVDDGIVIVIDMIKDVVEPKHDFFLETARDMIPKLRDLLEVCRERRMPIVHAASQNMQNSLIDRFWWQIRDGACLIEGSEGVQVADELRPAEYSESEVYLPKSKYGCFYGTRLDIILRNPPFRHRNKLIITGMNTNMCCLCTAIEAFDRDYEVVFVNDLNCTQNGIDGTPAETMHRITVETLKQAFVTEAPSADTLLMRLRDQATVAG